MKLTAVPTQEKRKYHDRGWTLFESTLIDAKAPSPTISDVTIAQKNNQITLDDAFDPAKEREKGGAFFAKFAKTKRCALV